MQQECLLIALSVNELDADSYLHFHITKHPIIV